MNILKDTLIARLFPMWKSSQIDLGQVVRWSTYLDDGIGKNMRHQTTLAHTLSFAIVAEIAALHMSPHIKKSTGRELDMEMLARAFKIHDLPEAIHASKKSDTAAPIKRDEDDLDEYLYFKKNFEFLPKEIFYKYHYAYLLQFAITNAKCFPDDAREIMSRIQKDHYWEALTKNALEKWEYLFYPVEMSGNHEYILTWILRGGLEKYRNFAKILPGFREEVFTDDMERQVVEYIEKNKHVPDKDEYFANLKKSIYKYAR